MTKREAERWANVVRVLSGEGYGISRDDIEALRRIEMTLHRWAERECNGEVEVGEDGKAWQMRFESSRRAYRIPNREAGALRRLAAIMARYQHLRAYHQSDPRGCALYVYRQDRFVEWRKRHAVECGDGSTFVIGIDSCYSSVGVAVCR